MTRRSDIGRTPESEIDHGWTIFGISYQDTIKLKASDLIESYARDVRQNSTKFWPGSPGVRTYLEKNLPDNTTLWGKEGFVCGKAVHARDT